MQPGWQIHHHEVAGSTNDLARALPPWSAVRADRQTAGRGRLGRAFVSNAGGLWISAVLPAEGGAERWVGFSLMVGAHLRRTLADLGVRDIRLRWPNDLLAGSKKLAGLLIEQSAAGTLIVGLGLNVANAPWEQDPSLEQTTTRLADLLPHPPGLATLTGHILEALAAAHAAMQTGGMAEAIRELNAHWTEERLIKLDLQGGQQFTGRFLGLDPEGNLRMLLPHGGETAIDHQWVQRLTELE